MMFNVRKYLLFFMAVLSLVMITTCDNPLSLGSMVNTEKPTINNAGETKPGDYLQGDGNKVYFDVEQKFGISAVYMTYRWTDLAGVEQKVTVPAALDSSGQYVAVINTDDPFGNGGPPIPDGAIYAQVTAIDVSGNKTTTTDMVYTVKNLPPQIEMAIPGIKGGGMHNQDGSPNPNYLTATLPDFDDGNLNTLLIEDPVFLGFDLIGLAEDNFGIAQGYPKIQIWSALYAGSVDGDYIPDDPGVPEGQWFATSKPNDLAGLKATKFSYSMSGFEPGTYRFRLVTKDMFGKYNYYPNRTDNMAGPGGAKVDPSEHPNKFIEIKYVATDLPIIIPLDIPQYYNAHEDFVVSMSINSQNPVTDVKAYIHTTNRTADAVHNKAYNVDKANPMDPEDNNYTLTIPYAEVISDSWPATTDRGILYIHLWAKDNQGNESPPTFRTFIYDVTPPEIIFDRPATVRSYKPGNAGTLPGGSYQILNVLDAPASNPKWVTGMVTVGGAANDAGDYGKSGITKLYYYLGKLGDEAPGITTDAQRDAIYSGATWIDTKVDTSSPAAGWNGYPNSWQFTDDFNGYKSGTVTMEAADLGLSGPEFSTTDDYSQRFYLPIYVKAVDGAGNYTITNYKLCVDPDLDIPQVEITSPPPKADHSVPTVGGAVRVSGIANDNNWVHTVQMRVRNETANMGAGEWHLPTGATYFYPNTDFPAFAGETDPDGWFKVNYPAGGGEYISWNMTINNNGLLTPSGSTPNLVRIEVRAIDTKDFNHIVPDLVAPVPTVMYLNFSSDVPIISQPEITKIGVDPREYTEGIRASGVFTISMDISDATYIYNLYVKFNNAANPTPLILDRVIQGSNLKPGWHLTPATTVAGRQQHTLSFDIDSTSSEYNPYIGTSTRPSTGYLYLEVEAVNERGGEEGYRTNGVYTVGIDNFYPTTDIITQRSASGTAFPLTGIAKDYSASAYSGNIQGLERVLVYFEKAEIVYLTPGVPASRTVIGSGDYLNPRCIPIPVYGSSPASTGDSFYSKTIYTGYTDPVTGNPDPITWGANMPAMISYPNVRNDDSGGLNGPNVTNFNNFPLLKLVEKGGNIGGVWESPHAMVIDKQELDMAEDKDEDGTYGEVWDGLVDKEWQARMNTTYFDDGPLIVHYIVMDQAGNATHYSRDIYIENHRPVIEYFNIGTDIDGNGNVDPLVIPEPWTPATPGEFLQNRTTASSSLITYTPSFRIRNNRFRLVLYTDGGNGIKYYKVSSVEEDAERTAAQMVRGGVYRITDATTDFRRYGAPNNNEGTIFVASGAAGEGTGKVMSYVSVRDKIGLLTTDILFNAADFGPAPLIKDSPKITTAGPSYGDVSVHDDRLFIIKVFDSTVPGSDGTLATLIEGDQQASAVLFAVDIDNDDTKKPEITVKPFYWNGEADNSLYENSRANGHIELSADLPAEFSASSGIDDRDPKISGQVSFRGTAFDNVGIGKIYFAIAGHGSYGVTGTTVPGAAGTYYLAAQYNGGGNWSKGDYFTSNGWKFEIEKETLDQAGHYIEWRLDYDSSFITGNARADNTLTVIAQDTSNNASDATSPYRFDVVPYISEVVTRLSGAFSSIPSAFNRSAALGWYPVHEEEIIQIMGFNFNPASVNVVVVDESTGTPVNRTLAEPTAGQLLIAGYPAKSSTHINIRIDNDQADGNTNSIVSGPLQVTTNSITSLNNRNNIDAAYNKESNNLNNNNLNNRRGLYVWSTGSMSDAGVSPSQMYTPFMRLDNSGNRLLSYGRYTGSGTGRIIVSKNSTALLATGTSTNRTINVTVGTTGTNNSWYAAGSNITAGDTNPFMFAYSTNAGAASGQINVTGGVGDDSNRFKIPRIAAQATNGTSNRTDSAADRILMSYFDDLNKTVGIIYAGAGTTAPNITGAASGSANTSPSVTVVASDDTTHKGSIYTAVGFLKNGLPVIVWYDRTYNRLVFSYGSGTPTVATYSGTHGLGTGTGYFAVSGNIYAANISNTTTFTSSDYGASLTYLPGFTTTANTGGANATRPTGNSTNSTFRSYTYNGHGLSVGDQVYVRNNTSGEFLGIYYVTNGGGSAQGNGPGTNVFVLATAVAATTTNCLNVSANMNIVPITKGGVAVTPTTVTRTSVTASTTNTSVVSTNTSQWQSNAAIIDTGKGAHVDMAVDGNNNIHLAYYDLSNGGLYYALIPATGTDDAGDIRPNIVKNASSIATNITPVRVDTYLAAGTKLMINVRNEGSTLVPKYVPYISYYHGSFSETKNSVRVAWQKTFPLAQGTDPLDRFTGAWEVMTVPVEKVPVSDEFICNGVPTGTVTSWATGTGLTARSLEKSILLGYMTADWYEGACLKYTLWQTP